MAGGILQAARKDARAYVTKGGFEEDIELISVDGTISVNITGLATKHHITFDTDGNAVNEKNVHICIVESVLCDLGYPVRDASGEVNLRRHLVNFPDSTGIMKNYIVRENLPDEALGLIVCILEDYTP
jgi:hypothetical protein